MEQPLQIGTGVEVHCPALQWYVEQSMSPVSGGPHWSSEVHGWHCPVLSQNPLQVLQYISPPQPSDAMPQVWPSNAHVVGVQHDPLSQVWPAGHEPQSNVPPQASGQVPQA
jgi:hypothetical protein